MLLQTALSFSPLNEVHNTSYFCSIYGVLMAVIVRHEHFLIFDHYYNYSSHYYILICDHYYLHDHNLSVAIILHYIIIHIVISHEYL